MSESVELGSIPINSLFRDPRTQARFQVVERDDRDTTFITLDDPRPVRMALHNGNKVVVDADS